MRFLKEYWFGLFIGMFIFWFLLFFIIVAFAPHQDAKERGFSKCTNQLAQNIQACMQNKFTCTLKSIVQSSVCDADVIGEGVSLWLQGKQSTPWANYYFVPEVAQEAFTDEFSPQDMEKYFEKNPEFDEMASEPKQKKKG